MLILFEETVKQVDEVGRRQLFQELSFLRHLLFHALVDELSHEDAFQGDFEGHFASPGHSFVGKTDQVDVAETSGPELLLFDEVARLELMADVFALVAIFFNSLNPCRLVGLTQSDRIKCILCTLRLLILLCLHRQPIFVSMIAQFYKQ